MRENANENCWILIYTSSLTYSPYFFDIVFLLVLLNFAVHVNKKESVWLSDYKKKCTVNGVLKRVKTKVDGCRITECS